MGSRGPERDHDLQGRPKAVWDSMALDSPWLNLMRNAMNAHFWYFEHPDSLSTSATHCSAHPAIFGEPMWDKYRFARLTDQTNNFAEEPVASHRNLANCEAPDGASSPMGNRIEVPRHRRAVFIRYHNAILELSRHLITTGVSPDHLPHQPPAAEPTNDLDPGIVLTSGIAATLSELQVPASPTGS